MPPLLTIPGAEVYTDTPAWLAGRQRVPHSVGASIIGRILTRPWEALETLTGTAPAHDADTLRAFARGHRFEPVVLSEYTATQGRRALPIGEAVGHPGGLVIVRHPRAPWLAASPDGGVLDMEEGPGLVEAKTAGSDDLWAREDARLGRVEDYAVGVAPLDHVNQVYVQLACTSLEYCELVCLLPRYDLRVVRIYSDAAYQDDLVGAIEDWRDRHLIRGEPLPVDGSDACRRLLTRRFPGVGKDVREATADEAALVVRYAEAKARAKVAEAEADEARNQIAERMGDLYGLKVGDAKALLVGAPGRETVSLADLRTQAPALAAQLAPYIRKGEPHRQLRLYGI